MRPPKGLPSTLVALGEAFARRAGIDPGHFWAFVYRRAAPPDDLRARIVEAFFPLVSPRDFLSTAQENGAKVRYVSQAAVAQEQRKVGRPLDVGHPFPRALAKANVTVTEWARANGYKRETVKHWYADEGRPIPRTAAETIEKEYPEVKASPRVWRNGIK